MPKIIITDEDFTTAVGNITSSYGAFVPGFAGNGARVGYPTVATEYTSLSAFKTDMGTAPQTLGNNLVDTGYMYACELLGAGLPVVYKVIPMTTELTPIEDEVTVAESKCTLTHEPADVNAMVFKDADGVEVVGVTATVAKEGDNYVATLTAEGSGGGDVSLIKFIDYSFEAEDYVDPTTITVADICERISEEGEFFNEVADRGLYDASFITTGGYPTVWVKGDGTRGNMIDKLVAVCAERGDCFALVDFDKSIEFKINSQGAIVDQNGNTLSELNVQEGLSQDAFVIAPWCEFTPNFSGNSTTTWFPGSFAFLKAFAGSIKTNNSWFATAGVKRGAVACNGISQVITNSEADALQPSAGRSVNAITYIKPYGYVIYGNRTLLANVSEGLVANSFINIRQLVHDVKRHVYSVCKGLMFDPNNDILWVNFKNAVTPLLEKMRSGQGISSYRLVKIQSSARGTLSAKIIIAPIEAVETFNITVELTDEDVTVTG